MCNQLKEDGHLTVGACGFTTWNETRENLNAAFVRRETKRILLLTSTEEDGEDESDEESSCLATSREQRPTGEQFEKPIKDAMTGQVLDRTLVAAARRKELEYFLAKNV